MIKTNNWVAYVCKDCHSDHIYFDALAEWDVETQRFNVIVNENKQGAECRDCSGSGAIAIEDSAWFTCDRCGYEDDTDKRFTYPSIEGLVCISCEPSRIKAVNKIVSVHHKS